jgi:hypothetical protein
VEAVPRDKAGNSNRVAASVLQQLERLTYLELGYGSRDLTRCYGSTQAASALQPLSVFFGLLDLRVGFAWCSDNKQMSSTASILSGLQRLTCLQLRCIPSNGPDALQPLSALTGLQELLLHIGEDDHTRQCPSTASMLGLQLQRLTRLEVENFPSIEPAALAGKPLLQHLRLTACGSAHSSAENAQLLSKLQHLQQLTELVILLLVLLVLLVLLPAVGSPWRIALVDALPPASAFAALTASSNLRSLTLSSCTLPADVNVWRYVFPVGKQLPQLTSLTLEYLRYPSGGPTVAPGEKLLAGCCPGLQHLKVSTLRKGTNSKRATFAALSAAAAARSE